MTSFQYGKDVLLIFSFKSDFPLASRPTLDNGNDSTTEGFDLIQWSTKQ